MQNILPLIFLVPIVSLLVIQMFNNKNERSIYWTAQFAIIVNLLALFGLTIYWSIGQFPTLVFDGPILYHAKETEFGVNFFMDIYSYLYVFVSTVITWLVMRFSRTYMHRERGFKRFYGNVLFFYFGLITILIAGSLEILFIGWEILGVTSFFLIGFYRERYLPVKNALKVVSLYRVADISLLCGIWISHHYFGYSIHFSTLDGIHGETQAHILDNSLYHYMISGVLLLAAFVKSGQFPFSSWVPRAMEGPTTSSAIFYGALSIHIGVFLLIRTAPLWEGILVTHFIIGGIGIFTAVIASLTARVQPSIKVQIAYSSIAQIGLMFLWVALGLYWLAMIHFVGNAFLRSYQLLVSPSILSYRIHDLFYNFKKPEFSSGNRIRDRFRATAYVYGIKEFNLDDLMFRFLWMPLKNAGNLLSFLDIRKTYILALPIFIIGLYGVYHQELIPEMLLRFLPETFALLGLVFVLKAFVERQNALNAWVLIMVNQLFQSLTFGFNDSFNFNQVHLFLSGIVVSTLVGIYCINKLRSTNEDFSLNSFHGHSYEHPRLAFLFVISCLGLAGFPITPTFIGEDLMLGHIQENQFPLLGLVVLNIILDGLVIFRIYSRLFLGQHKKGYHEVAYRSS